MVKRLPNEYEAIEGAQVAASAAADLLSCAEILADGAYYGIARSLVVLALEEAVK
jgi:AbiV family abortive infection protein